MPTVTASAPGRVNLIGEHTDYNGGLALPFAIPLRTTVTIHTRDDDTIRLHSSDPTGQPYVEGVVLALRETGWRIPGIDVSVASEVPIGAGLSSSAALECAVATALLRLQGRTLDDPARRLLARAAQRAETEYVGAPTGGLDQLAVMLCREREALLIDFADPEAPATTAVPLDLAADGLTVLITDTGVRHRLADGDGGYAQRRRECAARDPRRWRHVDSENERVRAAVAAATTRDWPTLGGLMTASHHSLRHDFEVTTPELDLAASTAVTEGALGARMTGGGFGGCTIALIAEDRADAVRNGIDAAFASAGHRPPVHYEVQPADGARLLTATT